MSADPSPDPAGPRGRRRARRAAVGLIFRAYPGRMTAYAVLCLVLGVAPAVFALLTGRLVDTLADGLPDRAIGALLPLIVAIGAVLLVQDLAGFGKGVIWSDLYRRYDEYLEARVMRTALRLPTLDAFEEPGLAAQTDRAIRITRYGPGELVSGLGRKWVVIAQGVASAVLVTTILPVAGLVLFVLWVVVGRSLQADLYRANPFWAEPLRRSLYFKRLATMPDAAKEQRIFGLTDWLIDRFGREWALVMAELWRARRVGVRTMGVLFPLVLVANVVVLVLAARSALDPGPDALTVGTLAVLVQGLFGMAALASQDGDIWVENGAIPVPDVLDHEKATETRAASSPSGGRSAAGLPTRSIELSGVRFAYPGRDPVYSSLDLTIEAGRSLAIVGLNGAGKTTLVKLLTGLAVPSAGSILVDGTPLLELDLASWRAQVAAIFQDFVRFQLPARDNIRMGGSDSVALAAASRAGASGVVEKLPSGLSTVLSRRHAGGVDLSGGQWQRIALARAMAAVDSGARVLVLDEPTAQLDVRAEADIYDRFLDMTHGLTSIVISHRFSTVRRADRIVVLESGRITEDGTHESLLAAGGRYARLFHTQASRYE